MISLDDAREEVAVVAGASLAGAAAPRGRWVVVFVDAAARVRGVRVVGLFTGAGATI
jgi:hypothetical protein